MLEIDDTSDGVTRDHAHQALLEKAVSFYRTGLDDSPDAQTFLKAHGLDDSRLLDQFNAGCCTGRLSEVLPSRKSDPKLYRALIRAGILGEDHRETLRGCLTIPIYDADGGITGIAGIDPANGQQTLIGHEAGRIWNARALVAHAEVFLATSILDGMALIEAGIPNTVALAAKPTLCEARLLSSLGVYGITLIPADRSHKEIAEVFKGIRFCCLELPDARRPVDVLSETGAAALCALVDQATPRAVGDWQEEGFEVLPDGFRTQFGNRRYEIRGIERSGRKLRIAVRVERQGRLHIDSMDLYSSRARRNLSLDLSRFFDETKDKIDGDVSRLVLLCEKWHEQRPDPGESTVIQLTEEQVREARAFGKSGNLIQQILSDYETCGLVGEDQNKLLCYLAAVSRKLDEPLSILILSSSGAGKSALQNATLDFCPPEDVVKLTSMTGKALFYKGRTSLKHRVLAVEEEAGMEGAAYPLRALISSGELVIETTVKDLGTGKLTSVQNRVEGPCAVFVTTTSPETDPETRSRFFVTAVDESREQTRRILEQQRRSRMINGHAERLEREHIINRHRNFQRLLQPFPVVNPFAAKMAYADDRLQSRRDQPKLLNLISAVAFLRQMAKTVHTLEDKGDVRPYIMVDKEDLQIAGGLAAFLCGRTMGDLNPVSAKLLVEIRNLVDKRVAESLAEGTQSAPEDIVFSRRELRESSGWPHVRVRRYLVELVEMEFVTVLSGAVGKHYRYRLCPLPLQYREDVQPGQAWPGVVTAGDKVQPAEEQSLKARVVKTS
jgi:hypothetical protein